MKFSQEIIESLIDNCQPDHKGKNLYGTCPWCGEDEFGISLEENHLYGCFRGKHCGESGNIFKLLAFLDRTDLIKDKDGWKETDVFENITNPFMELDSEEYEELPKISPPAGWRRIESHDYLKGRGFTDAQFKKYPIGITKLTKKFKDYIVFKIVVAGESRGYVSRSLKEKSEIDILNKNIKSKNSKNGTKTPLVLRYINSADTDFSKILYGIEDHFPGIHKGIIIVEGLFDKINIEIQMGSLISDLGLVVCCTWGKKFSPEQVDAAKDRGVKTIMIMYDPDAVDSSSKYGLDLEFTFDKIGVCSCPEDKDPGDMTQEEILDSLINYKSPVQFSQSKIQKRDL